MTLKILAAGDFHSSTLIAEKLAEKAERENVDLVILCGDLTHMNTETEGLFGPFIKRGKKVLFIPGNHDSPATVDFWTELYKEKIKNIHGYAVKYKDVGIFGAGFANCGPFPISEKELLETFQKGHEKIKYLEKRIMVSHVHPSGTNVENLSQFVQGSDAVRATVERLKPSILFCCHIHEAEGIEEKIGNTRVINVGKQGTILEL